jgi:hypothetical protein
MKTVDDFVGSTWVSVEKDPVFSLTQIFVNNRKRRRSTASAGRDG